MPVYNIIKSLLNIEVRKLSKTVLDSSLVRKLLNQNADCSSSLD